MDGFYDSLVTSFPYLSFSGCVIDTLTRIIWVFLLFEEFKPDPILNVLLFLSYVCIEFFLVEGPNILRDLAKEPTLISLLTSK